MVDAKLVSEKPINAYLLKEEIERIKKRSKEASLRVNKTEEYLNQFPPFKEAKKLEEALIKLDIPRLKEQHIHKIIDILPATIKDLKVVLQGYTLTINNENMKKIVDAVNGFVEKK